MSAATGDILWRHEFEEAFTLNPPTFANGNVYIQRVNHHSDSQLWSLNAYTGITNWQAPFRAQWESYLAPTVAFGNVWINGGRYGGLYGFNENTGDEKFFSELEQLDNWTPLFHKGKLYVALGGFFRQFDPNTGEVIRSLEILADRYKYQMAVADNGVAFFSDEDDLLAVDLESYSILWRRNVGQSSIAAVAHENVYVVLENEVNAYDTITGRLNLVFSAPAALMFEQPVITDDKLIVSTVSEILIFDRFTAELQHQFSETGGGC